MKDKFKQELLEICDELELSVRFNSKNGSVNLYEDMGEFECAEQAVLFIKNIELVPEAPNE